MSVNSTQNGFGLIEVLIVVVIMGFGLLGMARLQLMNTQTITASYMDTQVTVSLKEIIQRLRSNKQAAIDGEYNMELIDLANVYAASESASQAKRGLYTWAKYLSSTIPNSKAALQCKSTGLCVLAVQYKGREGLKKQVLAVQL